MGHLVLSYDCKRTANPDDSGNANRLVRIIGLVMESGYSGISRRTFLAAAAAGVLRAQTQQPDATFSSDVKVVNVFVTVRDKSHKVVNNLVKEDFDLAEEGAPQTIQYFSRELDMPLRLGLLIDTSLSQRAVLNDERDASYRFLERVLRIDRDLAFLLHFDRETELLQDFTADRQRLQRALDLVQLAQVNRNQTTQRGNGGSYPGSGGGGYPGGGYPGGGVGIGYPGGGYPGMGGRGRSRQQYPQRQTQTAARGGTVLYDAILLASSELMRPQQGRKALILLTDGVDNGSKTFLSEAIEAAQRADTLVYSVYFKGEEGNGGSFGRSSGPDGKSILQRISRETGGAVYEITKKTPVDQIYESLQEELRSQYSLGFTPSRTDIGTSFRKLAVTVKPKGLTVQTREGYYAR